MNEKKDRKTRRNLGAFYTPKQLAEHLTNQAIQNSLVNSINRNFSSKFSNLDQILDLGNERYYLFLFEALNSLKILDCASGEGEFLMASYFDVREISVSAQESRGNRSDYVNALAGN